MIFKSPGFHIFTFRHGCRYRDLLEKNPRRVLHRRVLCIPKVIEIFRCFTWFGNISWSKTSMEINRKTYLELEFWSLVGWNLLKDDLFLVQPFSSGTPPFPINDSAEGVPRRKCWCPMNLVDPSVEMGPVLVMSLGTYFGGIKLDANISLGIHPWRLTAGTCPYGGLVQMIFLSFHGWFVGEPS